MKFEEQPSKPYILVETKKGGIKSVDIMILKEDEDGVYAKVKHGGCSLFDKSSVLYGKRASSIWHRCDMCGTRFEITQEERGWLKGRGYGLPYHCKLCREKRRNGEPIKDRIDNVEAQKAVLSNPYRYRPLADRTIRK